MQVTVVSANNEWSDPELDLSNQEIDVHAVTGLLKSYLRELPEFVIPRSRIAEFASMAGTSLWMIFKARNAHWRWKNQSSKNFDRIIAWKAQSLASLCSGPFAWSGISLFSKQDDKEKHRNSIQCHIKNTGNNPKLSLIRGI